MQLNILKRAISVSALVALAAVLAGCGGGSSSSNIDEGTTYDPVNGKTIFRSLENETDMEVWVDMYINDRERVGDGVVIQPYSYINVEITGLDLRDYIKYYAEFENGNRTEGTFSENGATIFRNRSRASGVTTEHINGQQAVKPGAPKVKYTKKAG